MTSGARASTPGLLLRGSKLGLGLARYVAMGPLASRFALRYTAPASEGAAVTQAGRDPWNFWAFRVGMNAYLSGEQSVRRSNLYSSFAANRITQPLKIKASGWRSKNHDEYDYTTVDTLGDTLHLTELSESESYGADLLVAPSLGRHWGWASYVSGSRSTYSMGRS